MLDSTFITTLQHQLSQPLPGPTAQIKMASGTRRKFPTIPANAKEACVLCLLYLKNNEWHIVLTQRVSTNTNDRHSGQMSFPGGKYEPTDSTYENGALRETEEEVGIAADDITILGKLTPLYIPVSNFYVHPFVGVLDYVPAFTPEVQEVQEIVETPLSLLLEDSTRQITDLTIRGYAIKEVPYFNVYGKVVWGATAMMLSEFVDIIKESKVVINSL